MSAATAPTAELAPAVTIVLIAAPAVRAGQPALVALAPVPVADDEEATWEDAEWR